MTNPNLEEQIRRALRLRAEAAPEAHPPSVLADRRRPTHTWRAAAAAVVVVALGLVAVVSVSDDRGDTVAAGTPDTGAEPEAPPVKAPAEQTPRLAFDTPGFRFERVQECEESTSTAEGAARRALPMIQSFGEAKTSSPLLFVQTVSVAERANFGLLEATTGEPFTARGTTGYAAHERSGRGWQLSLELPDGRALYAIVLGLDLDGVIPVLDGLAPRDDGGWVATTLPSGMRELARSERPQGCSYSAWADLPGDAAGPFEINLYDDSFDSRLADRVAGTVGKVRRVAVDGVPATTGSYNAARTDHWVLFEPQPGRTMEIRASNMSAADVDAILEHARFVDEATWQSMKPSGSTR